jgi:hypothetical protein
MQKVHRDGVAPGDSIGPVEDRLAGNSYLLNFQSALGTVGFGLSERGIVTFRLGSTVIRDALGCINKIPL